MSTCPCLRVIAAVYTRRSCLSSAGLRKKVGVPKGKNTYVPPCAFHSVCSHPVRTPVVSLAQEIDGSIYSVFTWAGGSTPMDDVINTQWTDTGLEENEKELTLPANYEHVNYSQKFVDQLTKAADFQQKWWGCRHLVFKDHRSGSESTIYATAISTHAVPAGDAVKIPWQVHTLHTHSQGRSTL